MKNEEMDDFFFHTPFKPCIDFEMKEKNVLNLIKAFHLA